MLFFVLGLAFFFAVYFFIFPLFSKLPFVQKKTIGVVGAYTVDSLPTPILSQISRGLTYVDDHGQAKPDVAQSWEILSDGRRYVFHLKHNITFSDGSKLTSKNILYSFSDVSVQRPDPYTIVFLLKDKYAPFIITVSRPIFKDGFVGLGEYKVKKIDINGSFIESLQLTAVKNSSKNLIYQFYPTVDAIKLAFAIGEVTQMSGLSDTMLGKTDFKQFPSAVITKNVDYRNLVTLFYNTTDSTLSDKRIRDALGYGLPDTFSQGLRNSTPYPPTLWASSADVSPVSQDFSHAKLLLAAASGDAKNSTLNLSMKTLPEYQDVAKSIAKAWENIGIKTKIEVVNSVPSSFQIFLGKFTLPRDPDQYSLWHSDQPNNISNYDKNKRIDKLLEDGRTTTDIDERKKIYSDFQKYLLDDPPAAFLFFPYDYTVTRK